MKNLSTKKLQKNLVAKTRSGVRILLPARDCLPEVNKGSHKLKTKNQEPESATSLKLQHPIGQPRLHLTKRSPNKIEPRTPRQKSVSSRSSNRAAIRPQLGKQEKLKGRKGAKNEQTNCSRAPENLRCQKQKGIRKRPLQREKNLGGLTPTL